MPALNLTHTGKFSKRAGEMFSIIFAENGRIELSMGIGSKGGKVGIMVGLDDSFSTVFLPKEARALVEIITETNLEEEPYSPQVKRVMASLVSQLNERIVQAERLQAEQIERMLNRQSRTKRGLH